MTSANCPFEIGKQYQVIQDFKCSVHHFESGRVVEFQSEMHDRFQEYTKYAFRDVATGELNIWFVSDFEEPALNQWEHYFKAV